MSKSEQLYQRPVICKYCKEVFDFPTMTRDPAEDGVPVTTRFCSKCIYEMGQNEELRASRAQAEQEEAERRRSATQNSEQSTHMTNSHKSSLFSVNSYSQQSSPDSETLSYPAESPDQQHSKLIIRETIAEGEGQHPTERRSPSSVHSLLN